MSALLEVDRVSHVYRLPRARLLEPAPRLRVLHDVSLAVAPGESLGLVGESGSGKSTLARIVLAVERPTTGTVRLLGENLLDVPPSRMRELRRHVQMVFQDPYGSLNPRHTVGRIVAEPLRALLQPSRAEARARVSAALDAVGLPAAAMDRFPHEFSGGQRQRIAIARALITEPSLIVADEPVSALDVSVQAQVLNLMMDLKDQKGLAYLFISHDLAVVRHIADRVAVMYQGRIVEEGPTGEVLGDPRHPYTEALLAAELSPVPGRRPRVLVHGDAALAAARGCPFAPRCPRAERLCRNEEPALRELAPRHRASCHLA